MKKTIVCAMLVVEAGFMLCIEPIVGMAADYVVGTRGTNRPYSYLDDTGKLTGFDIELLREIERRVYLSLELD